MIDANNEDGSARTDQELIDLVKSNSSGLFALQNYGDNPFGVNLLTSANWSTLLETSYNPSHNQTYWNSFFVDQADKIEWEISSPTTMICHHYASYIVHGLGWHIGDKWNGQYTDLTNVWTSSVRDGGEGFILNEDDSWRYEGDALSSDGGWVEAPTSHFVGLTERFEEGNYTTYSDRVRFYVGGFNAEDWGWEPAEGETDWGHQWNVWTAKLRGVSYVSRNANGSLVGAAPGKCNMLIENEGKYLPWLIAFPCISPGNMAWRNEANIMPPRYKTASGNWEYIENYLALDMWGEGPTTVSWQVENYSGVSGEQPNYETRTGYISISNLGKTSYSVGGWNNTANSCGWMHAGNCDNGEDHYRVPDMWECAWHTSPSAGGWGMHLNNASFGLGQGCLYHGDTTVIHSDINGAVITDGSYNLTIPAWNHQVTYKTVTAKLRKDRTVTYDANGGTGTMAPQTELIGTNITLQNNGFTRTGYRFDTSKGWNTNAYGTGTVYPQGSAYSASSNLTLYAQWLINTSTLNVNPNGGVYAGSSGVTSYSNRDYNTTQSVPDPARDYYTFTGWNYSPATMNGTFNESTDIYTFGANHGAVDTMTAQWTPNWYKVSENMKGGSGGTVEFWELYATSFNSSKNAQAVISSITPPTRTGYLFQGYYNIDTGNNGDALPSGGTLVIDASGSIRVSNTFFTQDTTIYALWKPIEYEVNIHNNKPSDSTSNITNIK